MSFNAAAADRLEEISKLLELLGADSFRASANARAARTIADLPVDLSTLTGDREKLLEIQGIGPKIADKLIELARTGTMRELEELRREVPGGLLELLKIPGLGPKTARMFWQEAGVTDVAGLKRIIEDGSILKLPRMGAKAVEKIRASMEFAAEGSRRLHLGLAAAVAERIVERLRRVKGVERAEYAGSLRRGRETAGDIDVLVSVGPGADVAAISEAFRSMPDVRRVLTAGDERASVRVAVNPELGRWKLEGREGDEVRDDSGETIQVDLRVLPTSGYGAALLYFTGSKDFNVELRRMALEKGLTLNEYGLFPEDEDPRPPQERGVKAVAAATEESIFEALGMPYVPPELREAPDGPRLERTPRLVEVGDIRAELHAHTTASDGVMSIVELAERAKERGFHTIAVTDHSKSSVIANGLSAERLREHAEAVRAARSRVKGIHILAGSEVDILADGTLDYDDKTLSLLDVVVASPHTALSQDPATATERLLAAVRHPRVHVLGHPTGRLINKRPGLSPDTARLFAAAREHGVALEINAHWMRLDLRDSHARAALDAGCLIAIDCDVHEPGDFDNLRFGVVTGRRAGLTPERCVNCWSAPKLHEWLARKPGR